jgi:hypothetical protein
MYPVRDNRAETFILPPAELTAAELGAASEIAAAAAASSSPVVEAGSDYELSSVPTDEEEDAGLGPVGVGGGGGSD